MHQKGLKGVIVVFDGKRGIIGDINRGGWVLHVIMIRVNGVAGVLRGSETRLSASGG